MMRVRVLFFATLRQHAGTRETSLEAPEGIQVIGIKQMLVERYPNLAEHLATAVVAVNQEFAFDQDDVPVDAEVALFPPVSGG